VATAPRAFAGSRAKVIFDGTKPAGWATGVQVTPTVNAIDIEVMGDAFIQETELLGMRFSLSFDRVFILNEPLQKYGMFPDGSLTTAEFVNWPEATIEIYDEVGDQPIARALGCKPSGSSPWRVDRSGVATESASYSCKRVIMLQGA
jgi:hypothetical protein